MSDRDDLLDNQNNENKTHMANLVKSNSYLAEVVKTLNALLMGLPPPAKPETGQPEPSRDITPAVNENEINKWRNKRRPQCRFVALFAQKVGTRLKS
ncbi:MAG: hypothetical protein AABW92_04375 [Nanoarchaeota archaeon]